MTVAELLERMSAREFAEWMEYAKLEPFGEERADLRQAMTTAAVTNLHMAQTKKPQWKSYEDFMPFSEKHKPAPEVKAEAPAQSPESLLAKFTLLTGGKG